MDSCWVDIFPVRCEPGCPRPCHHHFRCLLLPIPSSNRLKLLLPTVNLFHQPPPPLANQMGVRGGQCGQQSVRTALPSSGTRTHDPNHERPYLVSFHSALGSSHTSLWQARHCGYDSVLELYGAGVGPLPGRECAADRPRTSRLS
jgi:hypothetical protein